MLLNSKFNIVSLLLTYLIIIIDTKNKNKMAWQSDCKTNVQYLTYEK